MQKFVQEQIKNIEIIDDADVLIVGGGPAGSAAAIAAARCNQGKVILLERYGYLGGMATGGRVVLMPSLSYGKTIMVRGVILEAFERLQKIPNAVCGPDKALVGSHDSTLVKKWSKYLNMVWNNTICYGGFIDPDLLKIVLMKMATQAGVKMYLHSWGCQALAANGHINGICFESKEGRKAIMAKVIIDCTGDADICASAGAAYDATGTSYYRNTSMGLVYRLGGADFEAYATYKAENPELWQSHVAKLHKICGFYLTFFPTSRNDIVWTDNWITGGNSLNVKDLTKVEQQVNGSILDVIEYLTKSDIAGLNQVWLYDIASQIGTRGSRRVLGDYVLSKRDLAEHTCFDDVIAVFPAVDLVTTDAGIEDSSQQPPVQLPLGSLLVADFDNLLVAGRAFSSDLDANNVNNLIPHCAAMGQAAGVAAICACHQKIPVRSIPIRQIQQILIDQDVYLPALE